MASHQRTEGRVPSCSKLTAKSQATGYPRSMEQRSQHVASLRQEITYLDGLNAQYHKRQKHTAIEQFKYEQWQNRLREIRQELLTMREGPPAPSVWWDRSRRSQEA